MAGRDQPGDLGGDRRGRVAGVLLPALHAVVGPVIDDEVRRRADVVVVEGDVPGEAGLPCHQQRVGVLVDLRQPERVGRDRAVELGVAGEAAVGLLGLVEQEAHHLPRAGPVAVGEQPGERLVAVAGEHLAVGPPGWVVVAGTDWPHGSVGEATNAPMFVLSSAALITLADSQ